MDKYRNVKKYFEVKADDYDLVEEQIYWRLSDSLLWEAMQKYVFPKVPSNFTVLDAGGGTGRWAEKILQMYDCANVVIYDISQEMLEVARRKLEKYENRVTIINGNLENISLPNNTFDLTINFHNVLGFVDNVPLCIKEICRVTKTNGLVVSFVPNLYHLIYFNISICNIEEAYNASLVKRGRFTSDMPEMNLFTPESISRLYKENEINTVMISGFPSVIYPNIEETTIRDSSQKLVNILEINERFNKIFQIEKNLMGKSDIAARGNNIFIVGVKRSVR